MQPSPSPPVAPCQPAIPQLWSLRPLLVGQGLLCCISWGQGERRPGVHGGRWEHSTRAAPSPPAWSGPSRQLLVVGHACQIVAVGSRHARGAQPASPPARPHPTALGGTSVPDSGSRQLLTGQCSHRKLVELCSLTSRVGFPAGTSSGGPGHSAVSRGRGGGPSPTPPLPGRQPPAGRPASGRKRHRRSWERPLSGWEFSWMPAPAMI